MAQQPSHSDGGSRREGDGELDAEAGGEASGDEAVHGCHLRYAVDPDHAERLWDVSERLVQEPPSPSGGRGD